MIAVLSVLCGTMLGIRYTVFCLIPTTIVAGCAVAVLDHLHRIPLGSTVVSIVAVTAALQFGYLVGAALQSMTAATQTANVRQSGYMRDRSARSL